MPDFSFGFIEGSFLLLNGQKHLRSVTEDLISDKQKELNEFIKNGKGTAKARQRHGKGTAKARQRHIINSQANISQQVITLSDFCSACENKYYVMTTSSA